ncbi:MAG: biopolymer transporter ExbD [Acidobacteria bacterium]|nr:biopolymer transporter ExbD [Acidobacteriota bacterium]
MAFSSSSGQTGGRRRSRGVGTMSDINIVPLVDVVLVLLIIFMLTAHVMEFGLEVEVPKVKQTRDSAEELPVVTVNRDGELYLNEKPANINALAGEIRQRFPRSKGVYVRADKTTQWETIAQVISELGVAKFDVRVVTQPEDESERRGKK